MRRMGIVLMSIGLGLLALSGCHAEGVDRHPLCGAAVCTSLAEKYGTVESSFGAFKPGKPLNEAVCHGQPGEAQCATATDVDPVAYDSLPAIDESDEFLGLWACTAPAEPGTRNAGLETTRRREVVR